MVQGAKAGLAHRMGIEMTWDVRGVGDEAKPQNGPATAGDGLPLVSLFHFPAKRKGPGGMWHQWTGANKEKLGLMSVANQGV